MHSVGEVQEDIDTGAVNGGPHISSHFSVALEE